MRLAVVAKLVAVVVLAGSSAGVIAAGGAGAPDGAAADSQYRPGHPCRSGDHGPSADKCPCPRDGREAGWHETGGPCPGHPGCETNEIKGMTIARGPVYVCCPKDATQFKLITAPGGDPSVLCRNNGGQPTEGRIVF